LRSRIESDATVASRIGRSGAARIATKRRSRSVRERRHRRLEGAAALEFALILPLFSILLLGLIDFGHFFFTMNTVTNAAREAARRASVIEDPTQIDLAAKTAANSYLFAAGLSDGNPGAKNCKLNCPVVTVQTANMALPNATITVTITIPGAFKNVTGFTYKVLPSFNSPFASMTGLNAVSQMRWELAPSK
jgi:Flp pilus assembly protein TadG